MSSASWKSLKSIRLHILHCENLFGEKEEQGSGSTQNSFSKLLNYYVLIFFPHVWELFWTDGNVKG